MSEYKLTKEIIDLSEATDWDLAKSEWRLVEVFEADEPEHCLCGHYPIRQVCSLSNLRNNNIAQVGNYCVKKFIGLPSDRIFQAVKRVRIDDEKALNAEAINHAQQKGWINAWEFGFSMDTMRKRKLSDNQLTKRKKINAKMLANMKRRQI
jgi:hypothetical protein